MKKIFFLFFLLVSSVQGSDVDPSQPAAGGSDTEHHETTTQESSNTFPEPNPFYSDSHDHHVFDVSSDYVYDSQKEEGSDSILKAWDTIMQNFSPEMLVSFELSARSAESFYKTATEKPELIRGGFFVADHDGKSNIDFQITNPQGEVIYKKENTEGLFHFNTTSPGTYSFVLSNNQWMNSKVVTFAVGTGYSTAVNSDDLTPLESHAQKLEMMVKDIQNESNYLWIRQKGHLKTVKSTSSKIFWYAVMELLVLVGLACTQIYFIKGMLQHHRVF